MAAHDEPATACSRDELRQDLQGILRRIEAQRLRLAALKQAIDSHGADLPPAGIDCVRPVLAEVESQYGALLAFVQSALELDDSTHVSLAEAKKEAFHRWRTLQALAAATAWGVNWQSPSFGHSRWSQAGTLTGSIVGTKNDYLRDHHTFGDRYEAAFAAAYVDAWPQQRVRAYATSSGVAAFAMAATCLREASGGEILVGRACWFQNRMLLERLFAGHVRYVDEHDTQAILEAVATHRPAAIFLDTLCNCETFVMPDLATLLPAIDAMAERATTVVLDNSCLAAMCQPLLYLPPQPQRVRLMVCEGLNKYHQFGADVATAGMLWTTDDHFEELFYVRMIVGANISDANAHAQTVPDRALHEARMVRIGRNARWLARRLQQHLDACPHAAYEKVVHPSLPEHPAHAWAMRRPFQGGSISLVPRPAFRLVEAHQRFIELAIDEARRAGVDLVAGSGFGFDTTRLYLTALYTGSLVRPFLRISAGTESTLELRRLGDVLVRTMQRIGEIPPAEFGSDEAGAALAQVRSLKKAPLGKWRHVGPLR